MSIVAIIGATMIVAISARTFTCENSTLLYSVKGPEDQQAFIVFQNRNTTRVFYQDPVSGLWDHDIDPSQHSKTCDFRVITQPIQQHCVTTTDGASDRDLRLCSDEGADPYQDQTVAEHLVLVACSSDSSAFAKVANNEGGVHFLAAYHSMSQLQQTIEWDPNNFTATIRNFMRKQTCDDDNHHATSSAIESRPIAAFLLIVAAAMTILL